MGQKTASSSRQSTFSARWLIQALFIFLWLSLLVGGYFWAHKPFDAATIAALGQTLWNIAAWLLLTGLGAAVGYLVIGPVLAEETPAARLALAAGAGLGLIAVLMGILGLVGWLRPLAGWLLIFILLLLVTQPRVRAVLADVRALQRPQPVNNFQRWLLIYGGVSLALTFLTALVPVTAWDSLTYHLTGPRLYLEAGRIVHPVDIPHLGFPLLGQMQYTLGMMVAGDGVAALLHFGYGLGTLALTIALARRAFGEGAAWFSALILLSIPTLFTLMSWPYVDVTLLFYTTAAFYAFFRWWEIRADGVQWLVVLGLACGFSGGLKYTAVATPIALGLSLIWVSRAEGLAVIARRLGLVAAISLVLVLPWLIENWLTTGNPVYPFFFDDALYWDEWRAWWYDRPGTGLASTAPWRLLIVPLEATIAGTEGSEFYEATIGPFILGMLFLLPLVWGRLTHRERAILGHMLFFFAVNYLLWLNGVARTALLLRARFLFLVFGVAAVMGGVALDRLKMWRRPQLDLPWMVQTILSLTLATMLFTAVTTFLSANPLPVIVGIESKEAYLFRQLGFYQRAIERINALSPDAQVLFLWETRSYACEVTCDPDPILDRFLHLTQFYGYGADEIAARWQAEGVTHVLLYQGGLSFLLETGKDPIGEQDLAVLHELQQNHLAVVEQWGDSYVLYALNP